MQAGADAWLALTDLLAKAHCLRCMAAQDVGDMAFADFLDRAIGALRLGLLDAVEQRCDLAHAAALRQQGFEVQNIALYPSRFAGVAGGLDVRS